MAFLRRFGRELLSTVVAVVLAVWWMWPARHLDGAGLAAADVGDLVDVTLERVEGLPKHPGAPVAIGWVGGRPLLLRTDGGVPYERTVHGKLRDPLPAEARYLDVRRAHGEDPYPVLLDASRRGHGVGHRVHALMTLFVVLVMWGSRLYRWRWADRRPKQRFAFDVAVPRDAALVAAVARRHAMRVVVPRFVVLVAITVPAILLLGDAPWSYAVAAFGFWAAVCLIVERRIRARLARVVRDGALVTGHIVEAEVKAQPRVAGHQTYATQITVSLPTATYQTTVASSHDAPSWATVGAEVRAVASARERLAIVLTPDGDDLVAGGSKPQKI